MIAQLSLYLYFTFSLFVLNTNILNSIAIKYLMHINGTRGKSTVCHFIDAGLHSSGDKVFTKTTDTSLQIINRDGVEQEINRQGKAHIRKHKKQLY